MTKQPDPPILSYQGMEHRIPPTTPEEKRWLCGRLFYITALGILFFLLAFKFGPNRVLFGKFTSLTPADFTPIVERDCVPVVRAVMEYQRDHAGALPADLKDLGLERHGDLRGDEYIRWDGTYGAHRISYSFKPGPQVWRVSGPFARGIVPVAPIAPATKPATR